MKQVQAPWRALSALTLVVFAVHLLILLRASPGALDFRNPLKPATLVLRTIQAAPPPQPPSPIPIPEPKRPPAPIPPKKAATNPIATPVPEPPPKPPSPPPEPAPVPPVAPLAVEPEPVAAASPPSGETAQAPSFSIPGSVRLTYKVTSRTRNVPMDAGTYLLWRHDGMQYDAQWDIKGLFAAERTQHSAGRITAEGLAPARFAEKASRSLEATHFQRDKGIITFSTNQPEAPLLPGAQDRLSVMLQLGALIAANPSKYPPETAITIQTASTREANNWIFTVVAEEEIELPGGTVRALKLLRTPIDRYDQTVELWLGTGMDYLPVRLRLTSHNEDWIEHNWASTDKP